MRTTATATAHAPEETMPDIKIIPAYSDDHGGGSQGIHEMLARLESRLAAVERNLTFLAQYQTDMFKYIAAFVKVYPAGRGESEKDSAPAIAPITPQDAQHAGEEFEALRQRYTILEEQKQSLEKQYAELQERLAGVPSKTKETAPGTLSGDTLRSLKQSALDAVESRQRTTHEFMAGAFEGVELICRLLRDELNASHATDEETTPPHP